MLNSNRKIQIKQAFAYSVVKHMSLRNNYVRHLGKSVQNAERRIIQMDNGTPVNILPLSFYVQASGDLKLKNIKHSKTNTITTFG